MQPCTKRPSHHSATQCNLTLLSIGAGTTPALAGAPLDEQTLTKIAELTQGEYYYAGSAAELKKVYKTLSSRLVFETRETEITVFFSAAAAVLALMAGFLSVWWFSRIL